MLTHSVAACANHAASKTTIRNTHAQTDLQQSIHEIPGAFADRQRVRKGVDVGQDAAVGGLHVCGLVRWPPDQHRVQDHPGGPQIHLFRWS